MDSSYKQEYDRVISLGMDCRPKVIMDITGLSGKRTALDVIGTQKLERLIHVLSNRFSDIFLEENLANKPIPMQNSDVFEIYIRTIFRFMTSHRMLKAFPPNTQHSKYALTNTWIRFSMTYSITAVYFLSSTSKWLQQSATTQTTWIP